MFTACPHCNFLVTHAPRQSRPSACPRCSQALSGATGEDPTAGTPSTTPSFGAMPAADAPPLATLLAAPAGTPPVPGGPMPPPTQAPGAPVTAAAPPAVSAIPTAPAAAMATCAPGRGAGLARWQWPLVGALALLLGLQVLLADRERLAADAQWRPLVERACALFRCQLPPWHDPAAFTMFDSSVRAGQSPGTLRVDATFRNDAPWPQAWPLLQLSLADADGRTTGSGLFAPEQYLAGAPEGLLAPGQSAHVTFMVREPAAGTVAFSFRFH